MDTNSTVWALHGRLVADGVPCHVDIETLPFLIGRRADLNLTVRSGAISSVHAEINERDGKLWIRDLDSKNGTFVNGVRIKHQVPLAENDLVQIADTPFRLTREHGAAQSTLAADHDQGALALVQLNALLHNREITPVYQPIVNLGTGEVVAFEALARSRLLGLETPAAIFGAASHLGMEADISHLMRIKAISQCSVSEHLPHLFVNTHPVELASGDLRERIIEMRALSPFQQLTLEIHEAALTDVDSLMELRALLREQDIHLAFDDFGVGQARIAELAAVSPDYVKFDRTLIAGIDQAPPERVRVLKCLVVALNEIQVTPLAEGIETEREAQICRELGFQLGQGFYFSRPAAIETFAAELAAAFASKSSGAARRRAAGDETVVQSAEDTVESGHQVLLDALKTPLGRLSGAAHEFRLGK
jgi:EAL domain-containing protein (putative c-di-GMP-specific phosphodiesterase class I)